MKTLKIGSMFAAFVLSATCFAAPAKSSGTTFAADALKPWVENGQLPGAISILHNNGVEEIACVGYSDVAKKRPITLDDVYMQCSQTKGFCGVTVAILVEEGKLKLDDPVSKYLPEFKNLWVLDSNSNDVKVLKRAQNVLTVRMVMNHTGGFPFELPAKQGNIKGGDWSGGMPLRSVAAEAAALPILFEPGTKVQYSNTGIDIGAAGENIDQAYVDKVHAAGFEFTVWTIDTPELAEKFLNLGVEAITSNRAGYLMEMFPGR